MKRKILTGTTWLLLAAILPLPLILIINNGIVESNTHILAIDLGIVVYAWWLADVYLSTRPQWLLNLIGMPNNYLLHGIIAVMAIVGATFHKFTLTSFHPIIRNTGNIAWYLEIVLMIYAILFMSGWLVERSTFFLRFKEFVGRIFTHQVSLWLHRLNFVVIALIWLHVQVIPQIRRIPYFELTFNIYTAIFLLLYLYKKLISDANPKQVGTVIKNVALTDNIQKITLKLNSKASKYHAGDFYFLSFKSTNISSEKHPFSVASKPNTKIVEFIIQNNGDFTSQISTIPINTKVQMEGPFGLFAKEIVNIQSPIILYGLGSGIAPLISLAQEYADTKNIHIIWSTNSKSNYLEKELDQLKEKQVKLTVQQHRYHIEQLRENLSTTEINQGEFFVVGSNQIVPKIRKNLKQIGVKTRQLHDEHLTM